MKKNIVNSLLFLLAVSVVLGVSGVLFATDSQRISSPERAVGKAKEEEELRGVWVATVLSLDYPSEPTTDSEQLKAEAIRIIEDCQHKGFNAIFLQVRPSGDALYRTDLAPWSQYLTGEKGRRPQNGFDPLAFWIQECHKRGMELHAWFNPYRLTMTEDENVDFDSSWVVKHTDGRTYLNPGVPAARRCVEGVVREVVEVYDVDGVHFDDYFYPSREFEDDDAYARYNPKNDSLRDWRIDNVNTLVQNVHRICESNNVVFGVSPFGIWANSSTDWRGSATSGYESLINQYADTRAWVKNEWVDYICPQIYWEIGYNVADYEVLAQWWADVVKDTDVKLYIGLASYRAMNSDENSPWYGTVEIFRQMNLNRMIEGIDGEVHFRYRFIENNNPLAEMIRAYYCNQLPEVASNRLIVGRPVEDMRVPNERFYVGGVSNPRYPLYLNGELVEDRTANGYFGLYLDLAFGENRFEFKNGEDTYVRTITRYDSTWYPTYTDSLGNPAPKVAKIYQPDEEFTLSCTAPAGEDVYAVLNGEWYPLKQDVDVADGVEVRYSIQLSLHPTGVARVADYGYVQYHLYKHGEWHSQIGSAYPIKIAMPNAPLVARFNNDADTAEDNSRVNGSAHIIPVGTKDYVVGQDGNMYKLSSGLWVYNYNVDIVEASLPYNRLRTVHSETIGYDDVITFDFAYLPIAYANLVGSEVQFTMHNVDIRETDLHNIGGQLFKKAELRDGMVVLPLKNPTMLGGYYTRSTADGSLQLVLRQKKVVTNLEKPLCGTMIMVDPGHGGSDSGSISLYGTAYGERVLTMMLSFKLKEKLENLGATVILTRVDNSSVSLYDRLKYSKKYLPDMFLSIHTDSMYESADLSNIYGATVYYKHSIANALSDSFARTIEDSAFYSRGKKPCNFYVCRGTWAPSVLLENGFSCNANDLEYLMNEATIDALLDGYVRDVVDYFKAK